MWFSVVCTLIYNGMRIVSREEWLWNPANFRGGYYYGGCRLVTWYWPCTVTTLHNSTYYGMRHHSGQNVVDLRSAAWLLQLWRRTQPLEKKRRHLENLLYAHLVTKTLNVLNSCCCFAANAKETYRSCRTIAFRPSTNSKQILNL